MPELSKKTRQRFLLNAGFALKSLKETIALSIVPKIVAIKQPLNTLETNGVNNNKESQTSKSCLAHGATSPSLSVKDFQACKLLILIARRKELEQETKQRTLGAEPIKQSLTESALNR